MTRPIQFTIVVMMLSVASLGWAIPIDFTYRTITSYSNQDIDQTHSVLDRGLSIQLTGNTWRKVDFGYVVTTDTMLEFDFSCSEQGEIHAIGLENNDLHDQAAMIQLYGTQTYGVQGYNNYAGGVQHYKVPVGQLLSTGSKLYVTFISDKDAGATSSLSSTFSNIQIYEQGDVDEIDFNAVSFSSYGGQNAQNSYTVSADGTSLTLTGNTWLRISKAITFTEDTVVEFEYKSTETGEIGGIGLDVDTGLSEDAIFALAGSQQYGDRTYFDYSGSDWKHYVIRPGYFREGTVNYLIFVNDKDSGDQTLSNGMFRNMKIYEDSSQPVRPVMLPAKLTPTVLPAGSRLKVDFAWDAVPTPEDLRMFVHIRNMSGSLIQQADHTLPFPIKTTTWQGLNLWTRNIILKENIPDGSYQIIAGLYNSTGNYGTQISPGVDNFNGWNTQKLVGTFIIDSTAPVPPLDSDGTVSLDLTHFVMTFNDEFDGPLDVSSDGNGTKWMGGLPYGTGGFGDAWFGMFSSDPDLPFSVSNSVLDITAWYDTISSHWRSGVIASVDPDAVGFSQKYGYFEMRAKLPEGPGTWPAFWMLSTNSLTDEGDARFELDVLEQYGHAPETMHSGYILHGDTSAIHSSNFWVEDMSADYHTYGVMYDEQDIIWYFDGVELMRTITPIAAKQYPVYVLVNLALGSGWPITNTPDPSIMKVDYVRVYQHQRHFETSNLNKTSNAAVNTMTDSYASGGVADVLSATGVGSYVTYTVPMAAGTWHMKMKGKRYTSRGQFQVSVNGVIVGSVIDQYGTSAWMEFDIGTVTIPQDGNVSVTFTVTGKNAASTGYIGVIDNITFDLN